MRDGLLHCDCCGLDRKNVTTKRLINGFSALCPECVENTKWTSKVLEFGAEWIVKRMPEKFQRSSRFSVTPINSIV